VNRSLSMGVAAQQPGLAPLDRTMLIDDMMTLFE
jgi:hypothetical protein